MHATATEKMAAGENLTVTRGGNRKRKPVGVPPAVVAGVHRGETRADVVTAEYGAKGGAVGAPVSFPNVGKLHHLLMAPRVTLTYVRVTPKAKIAYSV